MIELTRIVEHQASLSSYRATQNEERAVQLELLIEATKPTNHNSQWDTLISTPFRYSPPLREARFRPPYGRNIFYGSLFEETALYEHAFYFIKQRMHLKKLKTDVGNRTLFNVDTFAINPFNVRNERNILDIIDKNDYAASHQFVISNPRLTYLLYPSCRDPRQRDNAAILDIHQIEKNIKREISIKFFYDNALQQITWLDYNFHIRWGEVS